MIEKILFNQDDIDYIFNFLKNFNTFRVEDKYFTNGVIKSAHMVTIDDINFSTFLKNKLFELGILNVNRVTYLEYRKGDFFKKHIDASPLTPNIFKTCIIQLSNENDYIGGDLIVKNKKASRKIGNSILIGIYDPHEVTKIQNGIRKILVMNLNNEDVEVKNNII
jgi:predicted 2-oxoglutarate/Fe(II)-dependent dioxygenase YbiX